MLVPIRDQERLSVCRLNDVLQRIQLAIVKNMHLPGIVIDGAVGHLAELTGQDTGIRGGDFALRQIQHKFLFHAVVVLLFAGIQIDIAGAVYKLWHRQVVGRFHGNGDVGNLLVDGLLCAGQRKIIVYDLSVGAPRHEIVLPVVGNEPSEAAAHVDELEFRPQVHQTVAGRGASQTYHSFDPGPHLHQRLEPLGLVVFEGG